MKTKQRKEAKEDPRSRRAVVREFADEKSAGVVDAKPIWISPCAWLGARLLSRSADGPLFLSGSRQCSRCCGSGFGPGCVLLPFLLAGVLQLQLPLARHPRKSACEAKNVLCCKRLQGPGGRVNELPSIRKCRGLHGLPWLVRGPAPPGSPAGAPALAPPRGASRAYGAHVLAAQGLKTHVSSN